MKKQIVFFEPFPTVMVYKIAKLLREKGHETILIKLLEAKGASKEFHSRGFDKIVSFELSFFKLDLKNIFSIMFSLTKNLRNITKAFFSILKLKPSVIIARASPSWPPALAKIISREIPFIYFPYDIRSQYYDTPKRARKAGMPWFEIKAEKFCFENADAVIHKGDPEELKYLNGRMLGENIKFPKKIINFMPYCSKDFMIPLNKNKLSKKDNQIHIVYVGSMGTVGPSGGEYVFENIEPFVKQGIHVHMYTRPNSVSKEDVKNFFEEDSEFTKKYKDVIKSNFFHLETPVEPDELIPKISKYDFGIWPAPKKKYPDVEPDFAMGNKLSSYLEAGIPFISNSINKFINQVGKNYGIVFIYNLKNKDEMKNLKKNILKINKKELEKNTIKAREDFLMEKQFPRIERFIMDVIRN